MSDAFEEVKSGKLREGVPDISWTTEYATLVAPFPNTYAEFGKRNFDVAHAAGEPH
jgi:hypothetical protein